MPSSGSQSARAMSPSMRAREHEKKIKEREQRRRELQSPGPGSYEPKHLKADVEKMCGSTAFRCRTPRSNGANDRTMRDVTLGARLRARRNSRAPTRQQRLALFTCVCTRPRASLLADLDPGNYAADDSRALSARAKHSFAKSQQGGSGGFGTKSQRQMRLDILGEGLTPCPTQYASGGKPSLVEAQSKMPSSNFRSSSKQRPKSFSEDPSNGPGQYSPLDSQVYARTKNAGVSLASKSERFASAMLFDRSLTTTADVGPGAYEPRMAHGGNGSTMGVAATNEKKSGRSAGFRSESVRDLNGAFFAHEPFY